MSEDIAKMMLEMVDDLPNSTMGHAFKTMALKSKRAELEEELATMLEEELKRKVAFLIECENSDDLGWMDYPSWYTLPALCRDRFDRIVDPLKAGSGVYYSRSTLRLSEEEIFEYMDVGISCYELMDEKSVRIVVIGENGSIYDGMGIQKLVQTQKDFKSRLISAFGKSEDGRFIRKVANGRAGK